jgi:hypothetical protein
VTHTRGERIILWVETIAAPARGAGAAICAALLVWLALLGAWPYALIGGVVLAALIARIRRQDQSR